MFLRRFMTAALLAACCGGLMNFSSGPAMAALITPPLVTATSEFSLVMSAGRLIDGSGLSGVDSNATHSNVAGHHWLSAAGVADPETGDVTLAQSIDFELGAGFTIDAALLWNFSDATSVGLAAGVDAVRVSALGSDSSVLWSATAHLAQGTGTGAEPGQLIPLGGASGVADVHKVRLEILSYFGHPSGVVGLGEVRLVEHPVPEPSMLAQGILGGISLAALSRRVRRRHSAKRA